MQESSGDSYMLFQKKKLRARDTPTLTVRPGAASGGTGGGRTAAEEARGGLLLLDFAIQLPAQADPSFLVWRGGTHLAWAALPSASPAPQEVGGVGGIQGLHTELLLPERSQAKPR